MESRWLWVAVCFHAVVSAAQVSSPLLAMAGGSTTPGRGAAPIEYRVGIATAGPAWFDLFRTVGASLTELAASGARFPASLSEAHSRCRAFVIHC